MRENADLKNKNETLLFNTEILTNKIQDLKMRLNHSPVDQNLIDELNSEVIYKDEQLNKFKDDNMQMQLQIEGIKAELSQKKHDMRKKTEKIYDLSLKNAELEDKVVELRNKTVDDSERRNFLELKSQHELLNMKYQSLVDEHNNVKRSLYLYEKEIKNKNSMMEKLINELIDHNRKSGSNGASITGSHEVNMNLIHILKSGCLYDQNVANLENYRSSSPESSYTKSSQNSRKTNASNYESNTFPKKASRRPEGRRENMRDSYEAEDNNHNSSIRNRDRDNTRENYHSAPIEDKKEIEEKVFNLNKERERVSENLITLGTTATEQVAGLSKDKDSNKPETATRRESRRDK